MSNRKDPRKCATPTQRIQWLLDNVYGGKRSAMAQGTGVSLTGLIKVLTDQQDPGRRLLDKIVQNTKVNPAWLYAGRGQPFTDTALPVMKGCLAGGPEDAGDLRTDDAAPELSDLYSLTRYWLKLAKSEPTVQSPGSKVLAGDLMLMETDPHRFPPPAEMDNRWAIVRRPSRRVQPAYLARLEFNSHSEDAGNPTFEASINEPLRVLRLIVDEHPEGHFTVQQQERKFSRPYVAGGVEMHPRDPGPLPTTWRLDEIVALCVLVLRVF